MRHAEAVDLIRGGVAVGEAWADLGAGTGTFARALGELVGKTGEVWAVDRDPGSVRTLRELTLPGGARLHASRADFTGTLRLPPLDGILLANALHFVPDQEKTLARIVRHLHPRGKLLLVEYDRTRGNEWVPYPIPRDRFRSLAAAAGLSVPREIGSRRSGYQGEMYAAVARREAG